MRVLLAVLGFALLATTTSATLEGIPRDELLQSDPSDANDFVDKVLVDFAEEVKAIKLDPAPFIMGPVVIEEVEVYFYDGEIVGLSEMKRNGDSSLSKQDTVENLQTGFKVDFKITVKANATKGSTSSLITISTEAPATYGHSFIRSLTNGIVESAEASAGVYTRNTVVEGLGSLDFINEGLKELVSEAAREEVLGISDFETVLLEDILQSTTWPTL